MIERAPIRAAHLGLGAFFRAHQAWYTQLANQLDGAEPWGIWALTGRTPTAAEVLSAQDCRYTLLERGPEHDLPAEITSVVRASDGTDPERYRTALGDENVALVTTTITEKGYLVGDDEHEAVRAGRPTSALGRLVDGLRVRHRTNQQSLAVVPCDNLTANGELSRRSVLDLAERVDQGLAEWIDDKISFASTMVDRITPATTAEDIADVAALVGWADRAPVITEPFSEWVIAGDFPLGRPAWDRAGARIVDDVEPYEQRKLWLLNGGHSMLAYLGLARGHQTIAEAMEDQVCLETLRQVWTDAAPVLPFSSDEIDEATDALVDRFTNARIQHRLAQIAGDGSQKLPVRFVAVQQARRAKGLGIGAAFPTVVAAWVTHLGTGEVNDSQAEQLRRELDEAPDSRKRARATLAFLDEELAGDDDLVAEVAAGL
ncbi:MAG: mannitol dehydrogenase family protein [Propionibacteriales bacterium]|nr:mannitol dehydrogenase family protein [Propionibacteriales bacterium]